MTKQIAVVFYQTKNASNGGVVSLMHIIKQFDSANFILFTNLENKRTADLRKAGFDVIIIPMGISFARLITIPKAFFLLYKILKNIPLSAIHVNDITALQHTAWLAKWLKIKLFFTIRDVKEPNQKYGFEWRLTNLCQNLVVLSSDMAKNMLQRLPLKKSKKEQVGFIKVIYSHVPTDKFRPIHQMAKAQIKTQLFADLPGFHLVYVAAFMPKKNQLHFLQQTSTLLADKNLHLHFIGDFRPNEDAYAKACKDWVDEQKIGNWVHFVPFTNQIEKYYQAADIAILASKREGLARCMIEAMACETPVISFDVSSANEMLIENNAGIVVAQGDYVGFVHAIDKLLANNSLKESLGKNGQKTIEKLCNPAKINADWQKMFEL